MMAQKSFGEFSVRCLRRLRDDERGSVSVIFAAAFLPLALGVCAAVEISQAYHMRDRLNHALSASADGWRQSQAEIDAASVAHRIFDTYAQNFPGSANAEFDVSLTDESANFSAHATLKTRFLIAFGVDQLEVTSSRVVKLDRH